MHLTKPARPKMVEGLRLDPRPVLCFGAEKIDLFDFALARSMQSLRSGRVQMEMSKDRSQPQYHSRSLRLDNREHKVAFHKTGVRELLAGLLLRNRRSSS